jgi:hypothetical protein
MPAREHGGGGQDLAAKGDTQLQDSPNFDVTGAPTRSGTSWTIK